MAKKKIFELPYLDGVYENFGQFDVFYTNTGDMSVTIKIRNTVDQYCGNPDSYNTFHSTFSILLRTLGEGYVLQKHDVFAKRFYKGVGGDEYLQKKYFEHFQGREYVDVLTYITITKIAPKRFFIYDKSRAKQFEQDVVKALDLLQSVKAEPVVLKKQEVMDFIQRILTMNFTDDFVVLNNKKSGSTGVELGEQIFRSVSMVDIDQVDLPNTINTYEELTAPEAIKGFPVDLFSFLSDVPNFDCIIYNQVIALPKQQKSLLALEQKRKKHSGVPDAANNLCVDDIASLLEDVAKEGAVVVNAHFNILVSAHKSKVDRAINFIHASLNQAGIRPSDNAYNQLELYRYTLPGNVSEIQEYDWFMTTSDAALCFLFKEALPINEEGELIVRMTDRQGIPLAINFSDMSKLDSRNKFVLGPSGSGKSFLMNTILEQYMLDDPDVVIIDTGHSYSGLCSYLDGSYITYSEDNPLTMNPFAISEEEFNIEKKDFLITLVGLLWKTSEGNLTGVERDVISNVVNGYYDSYFRGYQGASIRTKEKLRENVQSKIDQDKIEEYVKSYLHDKLKYSNINLGWKSKMTLDFPEETAKVIFNKIDEFFWIDFYNVEFDESYRKTLNIEEEREKIVFEQNAVTSLSFDTFYQYAIYRIPLILEEEATSKTGERISFNFVEFRYTLRKFCTGEEFGETLNKQMDQSLFNDKFIVFEIDSIKEHKILFPIVTLIIMDVFIQKMRLKENRKVLVIEEAWKAIASPLMAGYILYLYKTVRKFYGEAIVVTQELKDIIGNDIVKDSIISNSDTICLLDQKKFKDHYDEIASLLSINDVERRKIMTINQLNNRDNRGAFKEVYIRFGSVGNVYGVEVSRNQYLSYTTEKPEKMAVLTYVEHYGDYPTALDHFLIDLEKSDMSMGQFFTHVNKRKQVYSIAPRTQYETA